ncbi:MAG TPA: MBL fold metallo-hydrolase [Chloroflexia bacterium]|nr:MBL fold metallo-hydrolase [Chloroflexia bacterium]
MRIKLLGAHQGENREARFMSILIDEHLVIDVGGLTGALSSDEQLRIGAVLLTHRHYDHIKDLPGLAHTRWQQMELPLYCIDDTRDAVQAHIFNDVLWPALREYQEGYYPVTYHHVEPGEAFNLLGYAILPVTVSHTVPAVGYLVERDGKSMFYTADTRIEERPLWIEQRPDLLIIETTMCSVYEDEANRFGHMTPLSLERVLRTFHARQGYYPRTVCVHMNPAHEEVIRREVAEVSDRLGADVSLGYEGMTLDL